MRAEDQVTGVSVCCRDRDDVVQIWNTRADLEKQSTILQKIFSLVPSVKFSAVFYKRKWKDNFFFVWGLGSGGSQKNLGWVISLGSKSIIAVVAECCYGVVDGYIFVIRWYIFGFNFILSLITVLSDFQM